MIQRVPMPLYESRRHDAEIRGVTGRRPKDLGGKATWQAWQPAIDAIEREIAFEDDDRPGRLEFVIGMALGFDLIVAGAVCQLKKQGRDIRLVAAVPPNQASLWTDNQKAYYDRVLAHADVVVPFPDYYSRNRWIAHWCHRMWVCWDGVKRGGTYYTLNVADTKGRTIIDCYPLVTAALQIPMDRHYKPYASHALPSKGRSA